ncbi:MAG: recombination mediator RecR [Vicinamibacteria bacterium]
MDYPKPIARLIEELRRLPGLGPKSAQRVAFHLLKGRAEDNNRLASAIEALSASIGLCERCNSFTDLAICAICTDPTRVDTVVCVVEEPGNIMAVDRSGWYRGRYHVLHGALSPIQGIGPDELRIQGLLDRVRLGLATEVILATSPTVEGEATAIYLARLLKALGVKVTRIATGIPAGSDLEWADEVTMTRALEGRREF